LFPLASKIFADASKALRFRSKAGTFVVGTDWFAILSPKITGKALIAYSDATDISVSEFTNPAYFLKRVA